MNDETIPPLPDFDAGETKADPVYPNREMPDLTVTQIPNPQKPIPDIDNPRPSITQESFQTVASRFEGEIGLDNSGRAINAAQFAESELFLDRGRLSFDLDEAGVKAVPDTGKIEKGS